MNFKLSTSFFNRKADIVARDLLGKVLVRELNGQEVKAKIVETEAYFDEKDPGSRARQNGDLRKTMLMSPGTILVYGVHNYWLMNLVTGKKDKAEAVLLRALEPLNFALNCSGPGLLTKAFFIDKSFHKKNIFDQEENLFLENKNENPEIIKSFRIGLKEDLPERLRFYIKDNNFVSRK